MLPGCAGAMLEQTSGMFIPISIQSSFVNTRRTTLNTIPVPVCCALAQTSKIFHALVSAAKHT